MEPIVRNRPEKPLLIFDGDCGFCRFWVNRWRAIVSDRFAWEPFQSSAARFPEIPESAFQESVQFIKQDGTVVSGADAVLEVLKAAPGWNMIATAVARIPFALTITRHAYRFIAKHRTFFSVVTRLAWGRHAEPPTFAIARRVFAFALGAIFLVAFASLLIQVTGLYGANGISPVRELLSGAREQLGNDALWKAPSIFWFTESNDSALRITCLAGMACAVGMMIGISPGAMALLCWALYLSFCSVGSPFLDFQWDALLLETGLLAAILLPWALQPRWAKSTAVGTAGRWLLWWLLFRLMVESGIVKLSSGDPTWRSLTALNYHFETQPLPLWSAWYAHRAPQWLHQASTFATFLIEFAAPLAIAAPRNLRHLAAWMMIALQGGILLTGNYAFFNWLTIALCLLLFEDGAWPQRWSVKLLKGASVERVRSPWARNAIIAASLPVVILTGAQLVTAFSRATPWPHWLEEFYIAVAPLRSFNSYGLFAVMTTERPEIIIEGSNDGQVWHAYEFKWKPGDIRRRPELVAPHQPRLDWQMWFAALSDVRANPWFVRFMVRLLEGSPEVLALLDWNPFPGEPPKYLRAVVYDYHFSESNEPAAWWRREPKGLYVPPISLKAPDQAGSPGADRPEP